MTPSQSLSPEHQRLLENASWLQRLATSLVRDPQLADDIVQQTMVAALEGAPDQVSKQRPWLARVLRNKVNANYRATSRRQVREAKVAVEECGELPHEVIERAEIGKLLTEAVLRLEEPFRTTLLMRYHEDKTPKEIARELGIPAATVRTRVSRGLAKLRREISHDLGEDWKSCAPALVVFAGSAAAGAVKGGVLLVAAALAIAFTATLAVLQPWEEAAPPPKKDVVLATTTSDARHLAETLSTPNSPSLVILREDVPAPIAVSAPISEDTYVINGRCVAAESGEPLPECDLKIWGAFPEENKPLELQSDASGAFEVHLAIPETTRVSLTIFGEGRLARRGVWDPANTPIESHDFGDILLEQGTIVEGKVLTMEGLPVPSAQIDFSALLGQDLLNQSGEVDIYAVTDENGFFRCRSAIPAGTREFHVRAVGYLQAGNTYVIIQDETKVQSMEIRVKSMPYVEGRVHFADGTPAAKVYISTKHIGPGWSGSVWTASDYSNAEGAFRIYATSEDNSSFHLQGRGKNVQPFIREQELAWGDRDIDLLVEPSLNLKVKVVEAGTGNSVSEYLLISTLESKNGRSSSRDRKPFKGPHQDGISHLTGLSKGKQWLTVAPSAAFFRPHLSTVVELPIEQDGPVEIQLERMQPLAVLVTTAQGDPVEGSQVILSDLPDDRFSPRKVDANFWITGGRIQIPYIVSNATTNKDGLAQLWWPSSLSEGGLIVEGEHPRKFLAFTPPNPQGEPLEVVVTRQCKIKGKMIFAESKASKVGLYFEKLGSGSMQFGVSDDQAVQPAEDGTYAALLDPGQYRAYYVMEQGMMKSWDGSGGFSFGGTWAKIEPPLGDFGTGDSGELQRDWDLTPYAAGSLTGRILLDGVPQAMARFDLTAGGIFRNVTRTDVNGIFHFNDLPPAQYKVRIMGGDGENQWPWMLSSESAATIISASETTHDFNFTYRTLRVRPLHPITGEPFPNTTWEINAGSNIPIQTDADGWLTIAPLSERAQHGRFRADGQHFTIGPLEATPGQVITSIEVQATAVAE